MQILQQRINDLLNNFDTQNEIRTFCTKDSHKLPFNYYECILSHLLADNHISKDEYKTILIEYENRNRYLFLFEKFGVALEQYVLEELRRNRQALQIPSRVLDANYNNRQYDLFLAPNIRIEVKTSRAVKFKSPKPLYEKALSYGSTDRFDMNFQQLKPSFCDVFIFTIIWRDRIEYLVLNSNELRNERDYTRKQHAGRDEDIEEGQLHIKQINIARFRQTYLSPLDRIEENIHNAFERE
jgi:hypothetical protein